MLRYKSYYAEMYKATGEYVRKPLATVLKQVSSLGKVRCLL